MAESTRVDPEVVQWIRGLHAQGWGAKPSHLWPRIAARNRWARVEALQRNRAFQDAYRAALQQWLAGLPAVFPAGTYKMRGKPGVVIQE
ncbi:MAG: hypothetical protein IPI49_01300 [Myxococcales bacterium]|nr:hypothetical protein [Myxococcales bacterium]